MHKLGGLTIKWVLGTISISAGAMKTGWQQVSNV